MSDIDFSEAPDFLTAETLARIVVDMSREKREELRRGNTERVIRIEEVCSYYWKSLRQVADLNQAITLINKVEMDYEE